MKKVIGRDVLYRIEKIEPVARANNNPKESEFAKLLKSIKNTRRNK